MTEIRLYDTMAREKRVFTPADPDRVTIYVCGPTVYSRAHIGNARPAVVFDVLAFRLTALGRGRTWVLFPLCVLFASATTIFLNLDTTAVLLTPVLLATARRARRGPAARAITFSFGLLIGMCWICLWIPLGPAFAPTAALKPTIVMRQFSAITIR